MCFVELDPKPSVATLDTDNTSDKQVELLVRLRVIERLQNTLGYPISSPQSSCSLSERVVLDALNWIAQCYAVKPSDNIAVAISLCPGAVTLHLCHDELSVANLKSIMRTSKAFLDTLRNVSHSDPSSAVGPLFRLVVNRAQLRIQHKLSRIGLADGSPGDTAHHFTSIVTSWMLYRKEGEQTRGFTKMAMSFGGTATRPTECMIQSFLTIVGQSNIQCQNMTEHERFTYFSSIIIACNLLVNSTFFHDVYNYQPFRTSLHVQDRLFLQKIFRRLIYIASYKTGAAKFAFLAIPSLKQMLGQAGIEKFVNGGNNCIRVELATLNMRTSKSPIDLTRSYSWPQESPTDYLTSMFNVPIDIPPSPFHSRGTSGVSDRSIDSSSTGSSSRIRSELSHLDDQLRYELFQSEVVSESWTPGAAVSVGYHPGLQLISHLERCDVEISYQAIGTSKPPCWACLKYVECLNLEADLFEDDVERETVLKRKWLLREGIGKVKHDWMIPPMAKEDVVELIMDDARGELERAIQEVVLDCCI